ncbi:MAG: hypothetical protein WCX73_02690 [Candidatus Pacearchaeota archaeon]|jgi:hypothetical protein
MENNTLDLSTIENLLNIDTLLAKENKKEDLGYSLTGGEIINPFRQLERIKKQKKFNTHFEDYAKRTIYAIEEIKNYIHDFEECGLKNGFFGYSASLQKQILSKMKKGIEFIANATGLQGQKFNEVKVDGFELLEASVDKYSTMQPMKFSLH